MIWLTPPPYVRWLGAALLVLGSVAIDCAGRATQPVPFAAADIPQGAALDGAPVEWRNSPQGLIDAPAELAGYAQREIAAGDPITASAVGPTEPTPIEWWSIPLELPVTASPGQPVRLVGLDPEFAVDGVVTAVGAESSFGVAEPGLVAVPPEFANRVARATANGRLVVLLG